MGQKDSKKQKGNPTELSEAEIDTILKNSYYTRSQIIEWHNDFMVFIYKFDIRLKFSQILIY